MNKKIIITTLLLIILLSMFVAYAINSNTLSENKSQTYFPNPSPTTTINTQITDDKFYLQEIEQSLYKSEYKKDSVSNINIDVSVENKKTSKITKLNFEGNVFQNNNPKFDLGMVDFSLLNNLGYKSEFPIDTGNYFIKAVNTAGPQGGITFYTKVIDNNFVIIGFKSDTNQLAFISNIYNLNDY